MTLGYNGFIQETEDAAALALGRNGFVQPVEEQNVPPPPTSSVVPATFVVADDREDYPLTQQGLEDAIAALPAGGGYIYLGEGTLTITSAITISKNIKIVGAGRGVTIIQITGAITLFNIGAVIFGISDLTILGDNSTASKCFVISGAGANLFLDFDRLNVNTGLAVAGGQPRVFIDGGSVARRVNIRDCGITLQGNAGSALYSNGGNSNVYMSNVISNISSFMQTINLTAEGCTLAFSGLSPSIATGFLSDTNWSGATTSTFTQLRATNSILAGTNLTVGLNSTICGCQITAIVTVSGANCLLSGNYFSTADVNITLSSADNSVIVGCTFNPGVLPNIIITNSSGCVVKGNTNAVIVKETGTSDNNEYADIAYTSELIGASSIVADAPTFSWFIKDEVEVVATGFPRPSPAKTTMVRTITLNIENPPDGDDLIVEIYKGDRATGAKDATPIATVTLPDGDFTVTATVALADRQLGSDEFLVPEPTQVGSVTPGSNLTIIARA